MATIRKTVTRLRVQVTEDNQKQISVTVRFNDGTDDYVIEIPDMFQRRLERLLTDFRKSIAHGADDVLRDLVVDKDYTVRLQGNGGNG